MAGSGVKTFNKHRSFQEVRLRNREEIRRARERIEGLAQKKIEDLPLAREFFPIFQKSLAAILCSPEVPHPHFSLSPFVASEVNLMADNELPAYLVHRYRYDIYPQERILDDAPPCIQIEPSSVCNFRCVFCFETDPSFTNKSNGFMGTMRLDLFREIIDKIAGKVQFVTLASRGEPLLCPDIIPMLEYTRGKFLNLKLNTNASLLNEAKCHAILSSGIRTLVFSADSATEPLYGQLRVGGSLEKTIRNIRLFQQIRERDYPQANLITRVSGVKLNDQQNLTEMESFWGELVDQVAFVNYNPWENSYQQPINHLTTPCSDLWRRLFIWWDGKVNPCDVDYKSTLLIGTIGEGSLKDIWRGARYTHLRDCHQTHRRMAVEPCNRCVVV